MGMFEEPLSSLKENFKNKTTPFFGVLIIVWLFENWELIYQLFNFDDNTTLADKIKIINPFLEPLRFSLNLLLCIGITFIVLVISYLLMGASKYITNKYEDWYVPLINKNSSPRKNIAIEKYQFERFLRDKIEKQFEFEKEKNTKLQIETDISISKMMNEKLLVEKELEDAKTKINELLVEKDKIEANLSDINYIINNYSNILYKDDRKVFDNQELYEILKNNGLYKEFNNMYHALADTNRQMIITNNNVFIMPYILLNLIHKSKDNQYRITKLGFRIMDYIKSNELD